MESRLLLTSLSGDWSLTLETPPGEPGTYELHLADRGVSTLDVPTQGTAHLSKLKTTDTGFTATVKGKNFKGTVTGEETAGEMVVHINLNQPVSQEFLLISGAVKTSLTVTDDMVRQQILLETPGLSKALKKGETLEAAQLILGWAARTGDFSLDGIHLANAGSVAEYYYDDFLTDTVGMSCGGYANYYSSILKLFDINSLNIGFGEEPKLTHVTVVVPIQEKTGWKFYLLDPTFGATFSGGGKTPATFFDLMDAYDNGMLNRVTWNTVNLDSRDYLSPTPSLVPELILQGNVAGNYVYSWPGYNLQDYLDLYGKDLYLSGYDAGLAGFVQLMENRVFNAVTYGTASWLPEARQAFLDEVIKRGIPTGW
ncbi:MAG: hypothetical protein U0903_21320 [Planctomycetales bacterium]